MLALASNGRRLSARSVSAHLTPRMGGCAGLEGALRPSQARNQPCAGLAGFSRGQSPLATIVIFPSKTAEVEARMDPARGPFRTPGHEGPRCLRRCGE